MKQILFCTLMLFAVSTVYAQPANDNFCAATPLTVGAIGSTPDCGAAFPYDNTLATLETGEPFGSCYFNPGSVTAWFSFVAPASGYVDATTDFAGGSNSDTQISIWSYSGPACPAPDLSMLTQVACDDDGGTVVGLSSIIIQAPVIPAQTYYLQVTTYSLGTPGTFCLEVVEAAGPPAPPANDDCANATPITCGQTIAGETTIQATDNGDDVGCTQGKGVWYEFTPANIGTATVTVTPIGTFDAEIGVATSTDCTTFVNIDCQDDAGGTGTETLEFPYTAGTTYYIYIGHYSNTSTLEGDFDIALTCVTCQEASFTATVDGGACPAINVDVDVTALGSATTVDISNSANASTVSGATTGISTLSGFALADSTVTIYVVDSADPTCIDSTTVFIPTGCPPANDECANATALTVNPTLNCIAVTSGTTEYALDSGIASCTGTPNNDVWFSFVATDTMHQVDILNVVNIGGTSTSTDMGQELFSDCAGTSIDCSDPNSKIYTGLTIGNTYYLRVYGWFLAISDNTFDVCVGTIPPPPANDECAAAALLTESPDNACANAVAATTYGATASLDNSCGGANEVWFNYTTGAASTQVTFEVNNIAPTIGGGVPTNALVTVYSGICGTLTQVSCGFAPHSVTLLSSVSYLVSVETRDGTNADTSADFDLCVYPCSAPANNLCLSAAALAESADSGCANQVSGTTVCASISPDNTVTAGGDVWYAFTPSASISYTFESVNTTDGSPSIVGIYSGACGSLVAETSGISPLEFTPTGGLLYYVMITTLDTNTFPIEDGFTLCAYPCTPAANDLCSGAIPLTLGANACTDPTLADNTCTTRAAVPAPTCAAYGTGGDTSGEVWFSATVPASGEVIIETSADTIGVNPIADTGLAVYSSSDNTCTGTFTQLGCNDDFGGTTFSQVSLTSLTPGDVLFIAAYEFSTDASGTFNICAWNPVASTCEATITFSDATNPPPVDTTKASVLITTSGTTTITGSTVFDSPCIELNADFDTNGNEFEAITNGCTPFAPSPPALRSGLNTAIQKEKKNASGNLVKEPKKRKARNK